MFVWDERRIEILRTLWPGGVSAREIADKIGAPSKNSIISKARRIGLPPHVNAKGHLSRDQRRRKNRIIKFKMGSKAPNTREKVKAAGGPEAWIKKHLDAPPKWPLLIDPPKPRADLPPLVARVTFEQLQNDQCKFPVGDPREPGFGFCGQPRVLGTPYCRDCNERARRPRETRVSRPSHAISTQSHAHKQGVSA